MILLMTSSQHKVKSSLNKLRYLQMTKPYTTLRISSMVVKPLKAFNIPSSFMVIRSVLLASLIIVSVITHFLIISLILALREMIS